MVRCCSHLVYAGHLTEFFDHARLEIGSLITEEFFREPVVNNQIVPQTLCHSSGFLVGCWNGDRELGEVIRDDKDVLCSTAVRFQGKEIHA